MTDSMLAFWLIVTGVMGVVAVLVAVVVIFPRDNDLHKLLKIGIAFGVFGLLIQVIRTSHYMEFGSYPVDIGVPLWAAKDVALSLIVYYFAFIHPKKDKP
jgi:hypothetical protein